MDAALDRYKINGYHVVERKNSAIVWKYQKPNDLSLDGCLYVRRFKLVDDDGPSLDKILLIPIDAVQLAALQDDDAISAFVVQELAS